MAGGMSKNLQTLREFPLGVGGAISGQLGGGGVLGFKGNIFGI